MLLTSYLSARTAASVLPVGTRGLFYTRVVSAVPVKEPEDSSSGDRDAGSSRKASDKTPKFWDWIVAADGGLPYKRANQPRNWLGGEFPFPLNPSFKPPAPIADSLRTKIYNQYMNDPLANSVRNLAQQYHLSLKRVDAILRLKGLEASWIKEGKQLQTGFLAGMEHSLGVEEPQLPITSDPDLYNVLEADALDEAEGNDQSRLRYQRMFFEPVVDGQPIMPEILERARKDKEQAAKAARDAKSDAKFVPRHDDTSAQKVYFVKKDGHATVKFVDVGGKFIDVREHERRMAESERRRKKKVQKKLNASLS